MRIVEGVAFFARAAPGKTPFRFIYGTLRSAGISPPASNSRPQQADTTVSNVISMDDRTSKGVSRGLSLRDRRFCIRYPFAADVVLLDLESGSRTEGVTSDISLGGAFVCTSRPLPLGTRTRI